MMLDVILEKVGFFVEYVVVKDYCMNFFYFERIFRILNKMFD